MQPWFRALEQFGPADGARWDSYIAWSGLTQLDELVSLDGMLCPDILNEFDDGYWAHRPETPDSLHGWIVADLPYLLSRLPPNRPCNVLAVVRGGEGPSSLAIEGTQFTRLGFDLIERGSSISALTNCGGFPDAFANQELSPKGLLTSMERAREVQALLRQRYPDEAHADCELWAIYRAV